MKKLLVLGSGLVAGPLVRYLLNRNLRVTIASPQEERAREILQGHPEGRFIFWNSSDLLLLRGLIQKHDIVVSLLPYRYHNLIARHCLQGRRSLVTTSYIQPEMESMHEQVNKAGLVFLNEIGLDPGLDHMSAMRIIDRIHREGCKVEAFYSMTGALPAPEALDNPFSHKFSWSPRGVLLAGKNDAQYLYQGKKAMVPSEDLFSHRFILEVPSVGMLECYPNRDSLKYIRSYGCSEASVFFRGTLRYPGWCETMKVIHQLGLLSEEERRMDNPSVAGMLAHLNGIGTPGQLRQTLASLLRLEPGNRILDALEWLGLFSTAPLERDKAAPFEVLADLMEKKISLKPGERDLIVMQHSLHVRTKTGKSTLVTSRLIEYGNETDTAVSRTVSLPAAVAIELILEKRISCTGVCRPDLPEIYQPVLKELEKEGILFTEEETEDLSGLPVLPGQSS